MKLITLITKYCLLISFLQIVIVSLVPVIAQDYTFTLPKVTQNNQLKDTEQSKGEVFFNDNLSLSDTLRFAWSNIDLNLNSRATPTPTTGYIKAYINEVKEENFLIDFASSPFRIDEIATKLKEGNNKLIFQLIVDGKLTNKSVIFNFSFKLDAQKPIIKIAQPLPKTVFAKNVKKDFIVNVENLIVKTGIKLSNHGKINIYLNDVSEAGFLTQITDSERVGSSSLLKFNSDTLGDKIKTSTDSLKSKLIFVPVLNDGKIILDSQASVEVVTNYLNTLDIKNPSVEFLNVTNQNNTIGVSDRIKIIVNNFKLIKFDTRNTVVNGEGYLQVFVNDRPHKLTFDKSDFSIEELVPNFKGEKLTLRLQLVNSDFTILNPEANVSIDLFVKPDRVEDLTLKVQASNWRLIVIGITIFLIIGSVIYIIFKT
jgi:hypothetical protein